MQFSLRSDGFVGFVFNSISDYSVKFPESLLCQFYDLDVTSSELGSNSKGVKEILAFDLNTHRMHSLWQYLTPPNENT